MRIELHGENTPIGVAAEEGTFGTAAANTAKARFFINGTHVVTTTTHLPNSYFKLNFLGRCTGVANAIGVVGAIRVTWNRFLDTDDL
jgi:hypothetical protein